MIAAGISVCCMIGMGLFFAQENAVQIDSTVSITTVLAGVAVIINLIAATGIWKIVRFVNLQKDFPPHRHINGDVLYPKDYAPEKAQRMAAGGN